MKTLTFINHKGGVSKTTSVANIGRCLAEQGNRVLLIDLDAQANLTDSVLVTEPQLNVVPEGGLFEALNSTEKNPVLPTVHLQKFNEQARRKILKAQGLTYRFPKEENIELYLLSGSLNLASVESTLQVQEGKEFHLRNLLERGREGKTPVSEFFDFVLIDCPPSLALLTLNAIVASDYVFIPTVAEVLPVKGLSTIIDFINLSKKALNINVQLGGVFVTIYEGRRLNKAIVKQLDSEYKEAFLPTQIHKSIMIAEAPLMHQTIFEYSPESRGAEDYKSLTDEILFRIRRLEEQA